MCTQEEKILIMGDRKMEVLFDIECLLYSTNKIRLYLPEIIKQLCHILADKEIADCLLNNVNSGDRVILIDKETNHSYRLEMQPDMVRVLGIYERTVADSDVLSIVYMPTGRLLQSTPIRETRAA